MSRVLLVTYEFPPLGGVGLQRVLKLAKYLPAAGWDVSVVTVADPPGTLLDESLLSELPDGVLIHRVWSLEPTRVLQWLRRTKREDHEASPATTSGMASSLPPWVIKTVQALFVPDEKRLWRGPARRAAARAVETESCTAVISSGPPNTAHLVAQDVARRTRRPWIADMRDPWMDNYFYCPPTGIHRRLQARLERQVVVNADRVLTVSEPMAADLRRRYPHLPANRVVVVPNGFDPADMPVAPSADASHAHGRPLVVTYLGMFQGSITPKSFLKGAAAAMQTGRIPKDGLVLRHIGAGSSASDVAAALGMPQLVRAEGFLPHREALRRAAEADVLLLVLPPGEVARPIVTGKLFEYLALRRPILALAPDGAAADIVREAGGGFVVDPDDPGAIADQIVSIYDAVSSGAQMPLPDERVVARFDRRRQAETVARLLNDSVVRPS
jgi:glycosyltransferase involved in cell wall biosynthesis